MLLSHAKWMKWSVVPIKYGTTFRLSTICGALFRFVWEASVTEDLPDQTEQGKKPRVRADAQRNLDALLLAAKAVFASAGVDAPVREIAERAGVGVGTLYRHFPQRADLIKAVFRRELDACADAAAQLAHTNKPGDALAAWAQRFVDFISAKRGLADALHSGDPAYEALPAYFDARLRPALTELLSAAVAAGDIRAGTDPDELLRAIARLSAPGPDGDTALGRRMVGLLIDGLRYGASAEAD